MITAFNHVKEETPGIIEGAETVRDDTQANLGKLNRLLAEAKKKQSPSYTQLAATSIPHVGMQTEQPPESNF